MFISNAYAQEAVQTAAGSGATSLIPLLLIVVIFYFFMIRPQAKKIKEHSDLIKNLSRNDKVITSGGIIGKIVKVSDAKDTVDVEIAKDTVVTIQRASVTGKVDNIKSTEKKATEKTTKK